MRRSLILAELSKNYSVVQVDTKFNCLYKPNEFHKEFLKILLELEDITKVDIKLFQVNSVEFNILNHLENKYFAFDVVATVVNSVGLVMTYKFECLHEMFDFYSEHEELCFKGYKTADIEREFNKKRANILRVIFGGTNVMVYNRKDNSVEKIQLDYLSTETTFNVDHILLAFDDTDMAQTFVKKIVTNLTATSDREKVVNFLTHTLEKQYTALKTVDSENNPLKVKYLSVARRLSESGVNKELNKYFKQTEISTKFGMLPIRYLVVNEAITIYYMVTTLFVYNTQTKKSFVRDIFTDSIDEFLTVLLSYVPKQSAEDVYDKISYAYDNRKKLK